MEMPDYIFRNSLHVTVDQRHEPEPCDNDNSSLGRLKQGDYAYSPVTVAFASTEDFT